MSEENDGSIWGNIRGIVERLDKLDGMVLTNQRSIILSIKDQTELEKKITTLENMHFTYDNPLDEDEKHDYQDIRLWERIDKLKKSDKETNQSFVSIERQLSELKEEFKLSLEVYDMKWNHKEIKELEKKLDKDIKSFHNIKPRIEKLEKKLEEPIMTLDHSIAIMSINDQLSELKETIRSLVLDLDLLNTKHKIHYHEEIKELKASSASHTEENVKRVADVLRLDGTLNML